MKKVFFLSLLTVGAVVSSFAQRYQSNHHRDESPVDQYYYYPDANVYYYPYTDNYIYYDRDRWCTNSYLPDYMRFNNSGPRIVINYRGGSIWNMNHDHLRQYRRNNNGHNNRHDRNYSAYDNHRVERRADPDHNDRVYQERDRGRNRSHRSNNRH